MLHKAVFQFDNFLVLCLKSQYILKYLTRPSKKKTYKTLDDQGWQKVCGINKKYKILSHDRQYS